jgi:hypothetical protein
MNEKEKFEMLLAPMPFIAKRLESLQRYEINADAGYAPCSDVPCANLDVCEYNQGEWVKWEDVEKLINDLKI